MDYAQYFIPFYTLLWSTPFNSQGGSSQQAGQGRQTPWTFSKARRPLRGRHPPLSYPFAPLHEERYWAGEPFDYGCFSHSGARSSQEAYPPYRCPYEV